MSIVMRAALRSRFPQLFPGVTWEWFIIDNPFKKVKSLSSDEEDEKTVPAFFGAREVTRREALEFIEENHLVSVLKTKDGEIWDTPDRDFQKDFPIDTKEKLEKVGRYWD